MTIIGMASIFTIGFAVAILFDRQAHTDQQLCVLIHAEWHQIQRVGRHAGVHVPASPPPCHAIGG